MTAPRLALFSPVPPAPSGVAAYAAGLLSVLPESWDIEIFAPAVGGRSVAGSPLAGRSVYQLESWHERAAVAAFDLNVYQVGNNELHQSTLPYVIEHPGLLVLHDAVLHPFRAAAFLADDDAAGYRDVLDHADDQFSAPVAEVVAAGLGGPSLYWNLPLCEDLVRASRHTVVHGEMLARWLAAQIPDVPTIGSVPLWLPVPDCAGAKVAQWRADLGATDTAPLLGTFGYLGAEHRVDLLVAQLEALALDFDFRLVVVGAVDSALDLESRLAAGPLAGRARVTGRVEDEDFGALLRATDLGLNLRYPSARAASGPLAQLLSVGTPAVVHDLVHQRDIPAPAVLRVPTGTPAEEAAALLGVLRGWLADPELRAEAALAAARWGSAQITPAALGAGYEAAVSHALEAPAVA